MNKSYFVYILKSNSGVFYIGVTSNLVKRVYEHQNSLVKGFTQKYKVHRLIYYEIYSDPEEVIKREKQLKNWNRRKKIELIIKVNPQFKEILIENLVS
jgi:putative endonuclease